MGVAFCCFFKLFLVPSFTALPWVSPNSLVPKLIKPITAADSALKAVKKVMTEEDFKVPSETAKRAVRTATYLVEWITESDANMKVFTDFFSGLVAKFEKCFVSRRSMKVREEVMWREYHVLRVSDAFREDWEKFLQLTIGQAASPTFFQFVSHEVFKELVKTRHEIPESEGDQPSRITKEEENALRYVSGYVCRKVQENISLLHFPTKMT